MEITLQDATTAGNRLPILMPPLSISQTIKPGPFGLRFSTKTVIIPSSRIMESTWPDATTVLLEAQLLILHSYMSLMLIMHGPNGMLSTQTYQGSIQQLSKLKTEAI